MPFAITTTVRIDRIHQAGESSWMIELIQY
jgi:hypothetical protein